MHKINIVKIDIETNQTRPYITMFVLYILEKHEKFPFDYKYNQLRMTEPEKV